MSDEKKHLFKKGQSGNPAGRPVGSKNRASVELRKGFELLAQHNIYEVQGWLDAVAQDDPAKALTIYLQLAEFVTPKLARTENVHEIDEDSVQGFSINVVRREIDK